MFMFCSQGTDYELHDIVFAEDRKELLDGCGIPPDTRGTVTAVRAKDLEISWQGTFMGEVNPTTN